MKIFVWLPLLSGPYAQLWDEAPKDGNGKLKYRPLFEVKLTAITRLLSLDSLILKYLRPDEIKNE